MSDIVTRAREPSLGVSHEDLAAHITASLEERDNLFVPHAQLADFAAENLLADFNITKK